MAAREQKGKGGPAGARKPASPPRPAPSLRMCGGGARLTPCGGAHAQGAAGTHALRGGGGDARGGGGQAFVRACAVAGGAVGEGRGCCVARCGPGAAVPPRARVVGGLRTVSVLLRRARERFGLQPPRGRDPGGGEEGGCAGRVRAEGRVVGWSCVSAGESSQPARCEAMC